MKIPCRRIYFDTIRRAYMCCTYVFLFNVFNFNSVILCFSTIADVLSKASCYKINAHWYVNLKLHMCCSILVGLPQDSHITQACYNPQTVNICTKFALMMYYLK